MTGINFAEHLAGENKSEEPKSVVYFAVSYWSNSIGRIPIWFPSIRHGCNLVPGATRHKMLFVEHVHTTMQTKRRPW